MTLRAADVCKNWAGTCTEPCPACLREAGIHAPMAPRDWFAAQALVVAFHDLKADEADACGRIMRGGRQLIPGDSVFTASENLAEIAYEIADAMLAERSRS